jgi:hypothetical protein
MKHTFYVAKINNNYIYGQTANLYKVTKNLLREHNNCDFSNSYYITFNTGCRVKDSRHAKQLLKSFNTFFAPLNTKSGFCCSNEPLVLDLLKTYTTHSNIKIHKGFKRYFSENVKFSNVKQRMLFNLLHRSAFFQHTYGKSEEQRSFTYSRSKYHLTVSGEMLNTYHDYSVLQYILKHKSLSIDFSYSDFADYFGITSRSKNTIAKKIVLNSLKKLSTQNITVNYLCDLEDTTFTLLNFKENEKGITVELNEIFDHINKLKINTHFIDETYLKDLSLYARTIYPVIYSFHSVNNKIDKDLLLNKFLNKKTEQKRFSCILQGINELVDKGIIVSGKYDRKGIYTIQKPVKVIV